MPSYIWSTVPKTVLWPFPLSFQQAHNIGPLWIPFYRWENRGSWRGSTLLKDSQLGGTQPGIQTHICLPPGPGSLTTMPLHLGLRVQGKRSDLWVWVTGKWKPHQLRLNTALVRSTGDSHVGEEVGGNGFWKEKEKALLQISPFSSGLAFLHLFTCNFFQLWLRGTERRGGRESSRGPGAAQLAT